MAFHGFICSRQTILEIGWSGWVLGGERLVLNEEGLKAQIRVRKPYENATS